jgi:UDP-GlcNAc:undecaprenyl-phosphate GlcNAc-1-phosphate transferase
VGIFLSTWGGWIGVSLIKGWTLYGVPLLPVMLCASAIFFLGLTDDIFSIAPQHKLAGQIVVSCILMLFGFRLEWTDWTTINLVLSVLWVVGITNALNLLDNMDGLAAGVAFIGGGFLFLCVYLNGGEGFAGIPLLALCAAFLGSLLGFLVYNFNPSSIFMGDSGSLFIGFILACLTMSSNSGGAHGKGLLNVVSVIAIPVLLLFIPILDTGFVSVMRKLFGRPISAGGKDHSSHRMVAIGFSEQKAVLILYCFSAVSGLLAVVLTRLSFGISAVLMVLYLLFVILFWLYLARVKVYPEQSALNSRESGRITPVLTQITHSRRIFEVLLDFVLISVAYYSAYLLRFEGQLGDNFYFFSESFPIVIACQILAFYVMGVYKGVWNSTGVRDLYEYAKAVTIGTAVPMLILLFVYRFKSFSRAVFVIYWGVMLILVSCSRLSFRILDMKLREGRVTGHPTLIYGAGVGGQMSVTEIETNRDLALSIVGFVDDNPNLKGRKIQGYPVLGNQEDLPKIITRYGIMKIVVAFKKGRGDKKREIERLCRENGFGAEVMEMRVSVV